MSVLELGPSRSLYYEHDPSPSGKPTFVFINALTGSVAAWQAELGPALRDAGYGPMFKTWDHRIEIAQRDGATRYADRITIDAGILTGPVAFFCVNLFPPSATPLARVGGVGLCCFEAGLA